MSEQACQGVLLDGFDFAAEFGERFAADLAEKFGVAPLAVKAAGAEASFEHASFDGELTQGVLNDCRIESEPVGNFLLRERAVGSAESPNELEHRLRDRGEERGRQARRKRNSERVAVSRGVLNGDETSFSGDAKFKETTSTEEAVDRFKESRADNAAG